jgi:hypothetical protein
MRHTCGSAALAAALLLAQASVPAEAKTCKDVVTAKARSAAQLSDASRERRARDSAIANWSRRARDTYGLRYSFWRLRQALHGQRQALPPVLAVIPEFAAANIRDPGRQCATNKLGPGYFAARNSGMTSQISLKSPWRPLPEAKRVAPAMPSALTMPALVAHSLSRPSRTGLPHAR